MSERISTGTVISEVLPDSPAWNAGLRGGDQVLAVNGISPRDIIEWHRLMADTSVRLEVNRNGERVDVLIDSFGEAPGLRVESALFDRVQTCDNHCEFCFIYQLPKGMRKSLYLKDDDYRLSFLFGNFTTLTRFTEADLERVLEERLSPLYVSVHSIDARVRAEMLRNARGGMSLRWLGALLDNGITVRAQIVLCPGLNDGDVLDSTLAGMLERYPRIDSIAVVPLGLSKFNPEARMRVHTPAGAATAIERVERWQTRFQSVLGRQPLFLSDEFYLVAGRDFPPAEHYGSFEMLEDGVGIARSFIGDFNLSTASHRAPQAGFFSAFDAPNPTAYIDASNPASATSLRPSATRVTLRGRHRASTLPPTVLTGGYGARVIGPLLRTHGFDEVEVRVVENGYFGGNTAAAGLMTSEDIRRAIEHGPRERAFLIPDVCLNEGRFLDGATIDDLDRIAHVEVIESTGRALRRRLDDSRERAQ